MAIAFASAATAKLDLGTANASRLGDRGTVALWVKSDGNTAIEGIFQWRTSAGDEMTIIDFHGNYGIALRANYPGGISISIPSHTSSTGWTHLAITWDKAADEFKFFSNGDQVGTTQTGLGPHPATPAFFLVGSTNFNEGYVGSMQEFGAWSSALSASEIALLGKLRLPPPLVRPSDLRLYQRLFDGSPVDSIAQIVATQTGGVAAPHLPMMPTLTTLPVLI